MEDVGRKLQDARKKKNLSVEQLSEKTKIRPYIINAIEEGNFKILPPVYMKSFVKTIASFLNVKDLEFVNSDENIKAPIIESKTPAKDTNTEKPIKIEKDKPKLVDKKPKIILDNTIITGNFTEIFKKNNVKKSSNIYFFNYAIYAILSFVIIAAVYFTFTTLNSEDISTSNSTNSKNKKNDTTEIKENSDNLLSYFEKPDSLSLVAKANDTAWIRINIDGLSNREVLMKPGMEEEWKAKEYFLIDQGNVGAIKFIRNGELLKPFGSNGSVIKNVKITADQVINANVWNLDTNRKTNPIVENGKVITRKKKKTEEPRQRIILEESKVSSPPLFKKSDTKPPN